MQNLERPSLIYGCMNIGGSWDSLVISEATRKAAFAMLDTAFSEGIRTFDLADIYCFGKSEQLFGQWLKLYPEHRSEITIQSKCGIRLPGFNTSGSGKYYDLSDEHIRRSVSESLNRLQVKQLDRLLLHRPDPLSSVNAIADSLKTLIKEEWIREAGVSNFPPAKSIHLRELLGVNTMINQIEFSLFHSQLLFDELRFNLSCSETFHSQDALGIFASGGIELQAWSPLGGGRIFSSNSESKALKNCIFQLAEQHHCSPEAIPIAWIMSLNPLIKPVIGTMNPDRLKACCQALKIRLKHEEWYKLLSLATEKELP